MIKIKIHSVVDLITNSSTEIFSYYGNSILPCKEMINEFIKAFGIKNKTCDDIFYISTFCEGDVYAEFIRDEQNDITQQEDIETMIESILIGEVEKPEWMKKCEGIYENIFYIKAKDEKHKKLANYIEKFLYSSEHDASYDG